MGESSDGVSFIPGVMPSRFPEEPQEGSAVPAGAEEAAMVGESDPPGERPPISAGSKTTISPIGGAQPKLTQPPTATHLRSEPGEDGRADQLGHAPVR